MNTDVTVNGGPWFADATPESGLKNVTHQATGATTYFFPAIMSPGAGLLDYDRDGNLDILLPSGCQLPFALNKLAVEKTSAANATPRLFRQISSWRFEEVTEAAGLNVAMYAMGCAIGDVNNDGFPDVYLTSYGGDHLFLNQQGRTFIDVTDSAGIDNRHWSASAAFFDYDRDGWLDLFVANYVDYDPTHPCITANGSQDFCNPAVFNGTASRLFRNVTARGETGRSDVGTSPRFEDVSVSSGIATQRSAGLGVLCVDLTGDGWPDVYVANDGQANSLWVNQRNGTFRDEALLRGVAYDAAGHAGGSMGVAAEDLNDDGIPEIFVTNLDGEINALYMSRSDGGFDEVANRCGLGQPSFSFTGFGTAWLDVENDGDLDVAVVNGRVRRLATSSSRQLLPAGTTANAEFWSDYVESNHLYVNDGSVKFKLAAAGEDGYLSGRGVSRGLAVGDIDNDGGLDLLMTTCGGPVKLFRNAVRQRGHWLLVRACDPNQGGRDALGAVITVHLGSRHISRLVNPGASYLSSNDPRAHFGLGPANRFDQIDVRWPDGQQEHFPEGVADQQITLNRGSGIPR